MTLRSIIIDDEYKGISTLKTLIEEYIEDINIVAETTVASEAIKLIENYKPEIVFLDINMPEMTGFELLEKLTWKNFNLVFITAHQEYALKALKNNAVDYILKPIDHEEVQAAVTKIKNRLAINENSISLGNYTQLLTELKNYQKNKILVSLKAGIEAIETQDIIYLESNSNYTTIYLNAMPALSTSKTLKDFEDQLCRPGTGFMRVHHSFIVNLNKVTRYLKSEDLIILEDGVKIPLSKSRRDVFYEWMQV